MAVIEKNNPIVSALEKVFDLFGIIINIKVLLPQNAYKDDVVPYVDNYAKNIGEKKYDFIVVYFDFLKNQEPNKWKRDTYSFWCKFFESLGVGYEGSDLIQSIGQIKKQFEDANRTNEYGWHFKLYDYIEKNKKNYFSDLRKKSAIDRDEKLALINEFKAEFESNKKTCVVLIIDVHINETEEWAIAGFNDEEEFKAVLLNDANHALAKELKKENPDRKKIIELATSCLGRALKDEDKDKSTIELIENKDYCFTRVAHRHSEEKDENKLKLSYLIAALKESALWGFKPSNRNLKILIIDDRLYDSENEAEEKDKIRKHIVSILKICERLSIDCYGLVKGGTTQSPEFPDAFQTALKSLQDEKINLKSLLQEIVRKENDYVFLGDRECAFFDYLLVDLWYKDTESMRGLVLISEIHHKLQEITRKTPLTFGKDDVANLQANETKEETTKIPEILAYSISKDAETIQMAQRMGAAGYIHKGNPEGLPLSIVRAGLPLELKDATRLDFLSTNNFPCIASLPRQIIKHLFKSEIAFPNADRRVEKTDDLVWIRSLPKADNHVHFGTAIPLEWCYILSLISLYHWNKYWENQNKESYKKYKDIITKITESISTIINNTLNDSEAPEIPLKPDSFRRRFLHFFSKEYKSAEVLFLKDVVNYLVKISDKLLNDKQIACLINVLIGCIKFDETKWKELYTEACDRINRLKNEARNDSTEIHNIKLFRDCSHFIENISLPKVDELKIPSVFASINDFAKIFKTDFDPLSEMLSTDKADYPYGLERYLASTVLVGSSLLQFADTVLLASMSIPEWAAAKKGNKNKDTEKPAMGNHNEKVTDNVIHLELRTTPQGFLNPYDTEKSNSTLASKLICVGLEFGIKKLLKAPSVVTANLLISIKRDRDRKDIIPCINTAVDMRDEYLNYLENNNISEAEGFMISHVIGLDVAGIERNNLPAELLPFYKEAFERCLLSTIHAGETERAQSVKDAIFMLNASRIGHGLSIKHDDELKRLIAERRICVELCPKSNQFTNGIRVFREETKDIKDKSVNQDEYVYNDDDFRGKMLLSINTDNPTISHKAISRDSFAYPLSEEFIWLSGMINDEKQIPLSRLEVLSLIYNGFVSMFAPEQAKKSIMSFADQEVLSLLAEEYLDIGKDENG